MDHIPAIIHAHNGGLPPPSLVEIWFALSLPRVAYGVSKMNRMIKDHRETLPLLAVAGAFVFVLSSLKLPSVTGSCTHPAGTGMGAIIFGPAITSSSLSKSLSTRQYSWLTAD